MKQLFKHNLIKITIYIVIIILVVWAYFYFTKKANSYAEDLSNQSAQISQEISSNYLHKLSTSQDNALTLGLVGETLVKKGFPRMGLLTLEEAIKRGQYRDIYLYTAAVYFSQGDMLKALENAELAKNLDPIYPQTYELMSEIYTARGDVENAKICYDKSKEFKGEK